jgi:hypothetical protein
MGSLLDENIPGSQKSAGDGDFSDALKREFL